MTDPRLYLLILWFCLIAYQCLADGTNGATAHKPQVDIPMEMHRVLRAAIGVVNADTYCHPMLSRADAVKAGVSELHDAVEDYKRVYCYGQASAPPTEADAGEG